jgi:sigma-B regulation protein RsbU (phosphoserine phosphatase)
MSPRPRIRFSIAAKILATLLSLSLVALTIAGWLALGNMASLGESALSSVSGLGEQAVGESSAALRAMTETDLVQLAKDQAAIADAFFARAASEVEVMASYASVLWRVPPPPVQHPSRAKNDPPIDTRGASTWAYAPGTDEAELKPRLELLGNMDDIYIPIVANDRNITWTYIGTREGAFRVYPWRDLPATYDPRQRPWFTRAVVYGKTGWTAPYIDPSFNDLKVACSTPVRAPGGYIVAVVGADISLQDINRNIIGTQVGKGGYAFMLDSSGNVMARPGLAPGDTRWDASFKTDNYLLVDEVDLRGIAGQMVTSQTGVATARLGEEDRYIAYAPVPSTGWSIGIVLPVSEVVAPAEAARVRIESATAGVRERLDAQRAQAFNIFLVVFIAMLAAVAVIAWLLARRISRPILALNSGAQAIGAGNLDFKLDLHTGDEIEDLAGAFNKMTADLQLHIAQLQATTATKERIESELRVATEIQNTMLPRLFPPFPDRREIDIYATMKPAREVGGDLYDFFFTGPDQLYLVVGDVCGKGIPAALFMAISRTLIKTEAQRGLSPGEVLARVNDTLAPDNDTSMFLTVFCALLDVKTGELVVASGGHNPPLLSTGAGCAYMEVPKGVPVGPMEGMRYKEKMFQLAAGDTLFVYTDGVTEATDRANHLYSEDRLKAYLAGVKESEVMQIVKGVAADIETFVAGAEQSDDITMVAVRFRGRPPAARAG